MKFKTTNSDLFKLNFLDTKYFIRSIESGFYSFEVTANSSFMFLYSIKTNQYLVFILTKFYILQQ